MKLGIIYYLGFGSILRPECGAYRGNPSCYADAGLGPDNVFRSDSTFPPDGLSCIHSLFQALRRTQIRVARCCKTAKAACPSNAACSCVQLILRHPIVTLLYLCPVAIRPRTLRWLLRSPRAWRRLHSPCAGFGQSRSCHTE